MAAPAPPQTISIKEASERLGVHQNTIRNWMDRGLLDGYLTPTSRRKLRLNEVERLEREMHGVPIAPRELQGAVPAPPQTARVEHAQGRLP